ncbi:MAG: hypothetical protein H0X29_06345 [Parachlamydiaceae bacterium]|nr:hypothetical protein [Parachlamydiaceae bacterium]
MVFQISTTTINPTLIPSNQPLPTERNLTPLQKKVVNRLRETTDKIVKEVITALIASKSVSVDIFLDNYNVKKTNSIPVLDKRTQEFTHRLLAVVDEDLNKIVGLSKSFDALASYAKDPTIREKFITEIALSSIKDLILDFDKINPSIINDINAHYHKNKPSWKVKILSNFAQFKWSHIPTWQKTASITTCAIVILACLCWSAKSISEVPYNIQGAKKVRTKLNDILKEKFTSRTIYTSDSGHLKFSQCVGPLSTVEVMMNIPYGENALTKAGQFLAKIDSLIMRKCCFLIFSNITGSPLQTDTEMALKVESDCPIP